MIIKYRNYSRALIELAIENKSLDVVYNDFFSFMEFISNNPKYLNNLINKYQYNLDIFNFSDIFKNFLKVLIKDSKIKYIKLIYDYFRELSNKYENEAYFRVYTTKKLKKDQEENIINYLKINFPGKKIIMKQKVDENMIGGIKILYKGQSLDMSLKNRLDNLFDSI